MSFTSDYEAYLGDLCAALGHKNRHESFRGYCRALMLPLERKSVEPMAAVVDPEHVQARHQSLHHFVSSSPWSDRALLDAVFEKASEAMGEARRYWLVDDTGMPKKGSHSVGVAHQYCGQLGKSANCQVAVSLSFATEAASVPIDYRLYLPKGWAEDGTRRTAVGVPEEVVFQTKQSIALEQIRSARARGVPPGVVVADAGYGVDTAFREALDAEGLEYLLGVQPHTTIWPPGVEPLAPVSTGRGRPPSRMRFAEGHQPVRADRFATETLARQAWRTVSWREGTNAPLSSRFARVRVRAAHRDSWRAERRPEQWLLMEWPRGEAAPTKYFLSTLPTTATLTELVHVAKMRWRIERDYQELKQELGLNHYEGRSWRGFHHHASLCIAAYAYLVIDRLRHPARKKKRPPAHAPVLPEGYRPRGAPAEAAAR